MKAVCLYQQNTNVPTKHTSKEVQRAWMRERREKSKQKMKPDWGREEMTPVTLILFNYFKHSFK